METRIIKLSIFFALNFYFLSNGKEWINKKNLRLYNLKVDTGVTRKLYGQNIFVKTKHFKISTSYLHFSKMLNSNRDYYGIKHNLSYKQFINKVGFGIDVGFAYQHETRHYPNPPIYKLSLYNIEISMAYGLYSKNKLGLSCDFGCGISNSGSYLAGRINTFYKISPLIYTSFSLGYLNGIESGKNGAFRTNFSNSFYPEVSLTYSLNPILRSDLVKGNKVFKKLSVALIIGTNLIAKQEGIGNDPKKYPFVFKTNKTEFDDGDRLMKGLEIFFQHKKIIHSIGCAYRNSSYRQRTHTSFIYWSDEIKQKDIYYKFSTIINVLSSKRLKNISGIRFTNRIKNGGNYYSSYYDGYGYKSKYMSYKTNQFVLQPVLGYRYLEGRVFLETELLMTFLNYTIGKYSYEDIPSSMPPIKNREYKEGNYNNLYFKPIFASNAFFDQLIFKLGFFIY